MNQRREQMFYYFINRFVLFVCSSNHNRTCEYLHDISKTFLANYNFCRLFTFVSGLLIILFLKAYFQILLQEAGLGRQSS